MKPPSSQGVVAVADTKAECKVVLDAIEDQSAPLTPPQSDGFEDSLGVRFRRQAQFEPRPPHASAYVELRLKPEPEFAVEPRDVDFIIGAAHRVVDQKKLLDRIFNVVTGRQRAARTMIRMLETGTTSM